MQGNIQSNGLFGMQNGQAANNNMNSGGLFGNSQPLQQASGGGLFGSAGTGTTQQNQGGLFQQPQQQQQQPQQGGLFGGNQQQPPATGGLFSQGAPQQQTGGLFGNNNNNNGQQPASGFFGQATQQQPQQQPQQPQQQNMLFGSNQPTAPQTGGLFGQGAPNGQPTTGAGLFGQQQNQTTAQPQGQGLFGNQPAATTPGLFGATPATQQQTPAAAAASTTPAPGSGNLFGNLSTGQPQTQQTSNLFGGTGAATTPTTTAQVNQPAAQQSQGGLFGGQATQATTTTTTQNLGQPTSGGMFGTNAPATGQTNLFGASQPNSQTVPPSQSTAPTGLFANKPAEQANATSQVPTTTPAATTAQPTITPPTASGGLFAQQPKQPATQATTTTPAPATTQGGLFGPKVDAAAPATSTTTTTSTTGGLFGPSTTTQPAPAQTPAPNAGGLFAKPNDLTTGPQAAPTGGLFAANNTASTGAAQTTPAQGTLFSKQPATVGQQTALAFATTGTPAATSQQQQQAPAAAAGQPPKPSQPPASQQASVSLFDNSNKPPAASTAAPATGLPTATAPKPVTPAVGGGLFGTGTGAPAAAATTTTPATAQAPQVPPVGTGAMAPPPAYTNPSGAATTTTTTATAPGGLPASRKAPTSSAITSANKNDILSIEIETSRKLNGSLHMFCQNINKYSNEQVKAFFQDPVILNKLQQGLILFQADQTNSDKWESIKLEAKEGKTPLVFWNDRLSKYKFQYLIVLLIEELASYLEIKPIDAYNYFNIFLSHESKMVDIFFDPASNEPCIEFFYEHHALTYETGNITINKEAPFIQNLKTNFMQDMYFHERNCILASLRLLLLLSEEEESNSVVRDVVSKLLKGGLEASLWKQYMTPQTNKVLNPDDSDAFMLQLQFEQDQLLKLLFIISKHKETTEFKQVTEYFKVFSAEHFLGNQNLLQNVNGSESNSFENKNKMIDFATVIGDSGLMLILSLLERIAKGSNKNTKEILDALMPDLRSAQSSPQAQIVGLQISAFDKKVKIERLEEIENLYKVVTRIIGYKNLGILKATYQEIFFTMIFKVFSGMYDTELDPQTDLFLSEILARTLEKIISKNAKLIDLFWDELQQASVLDHFKARFSTTLPLYKIMKSAMGSSLDPKADKVIVFLSNIQDFSWFNFYRSIHQQAYSRVASNVINCHHNLFLYNNRGIPDEEDLLRMRLIYKLICVDPKCIELLQLSFTHEQLNLQVFERNIGDCRGDEVIRFVLRSLTYYANVRLPVLQNFFCGLKAVNVLLNNKQNLTQQVLQSEEYSEIITREYRRLAMLNEQNSTKYRLKCKREILSILLTILRDFEEPLLAFAPQRGLDRNVEYDSPLLLHLFIFFLSFVEDWDQNSGLALLKHKWKTGTLIMQITEICLSRLSMNIHKKNDFRPVQSDIYTTYFLNGFILPHLKKLRIDDMIMKILEVSANFSSMGKLNEHSLSSQQQQLTNSSAKNLKLKNKFWQTYVSNSTLKFKEFQMEQIKGQRNLRVLILNTMRVVERILGLVQQKISIRKQDFEVRFLQKSMLFEDIPLLDFFERILCKLDCVFHYKQEYFFKHNHGHNERHSSSSCPVDSMKINLIYALASYVNFENRVFAAGDEYSNPSLPFYLYNLLDGEAMLINSIGDAHLLIDYNTIRNPLNLASIPNGTFVNSISALSLRILTQIMLVWEGQSSIRKPILVDFLTNMNMENYWEKANYSSVKIQLSTFVHEMLNILRQNELKNLPSSVLQRKALADETCAVLDFLLTAIHTQPLLINIILKPDSLPSKSVKADNDLKTRFQRFFETDSSSKDPRLFNKYLNLLSEIFARESMYAQFCQEFRQGSQNIFEKMTQVALESFKPFEIDALVERELGAAPAANEGHVREFQKWKISTLLRDQVSHSQLHSHMLSIHSFHILLDILANEYLSNKLKSTEAIQTSLKTIFELNKMNDFISSLGQFSPSYALEYQDPLAIPIQSKQSAALNQSSASAGATPAMEQELPTNRSSSRNIFTQQIWQLLEVNTYGYGWNYAQDASEIVFNKVDIERGGEFFDRAKFIVFKSSQLRAKSLKWSIEEIKAKSFDSWIRLFCLVNSAGSEGFAMSAVSSSLPNFTVKQLRDKKIVQDHDQLQLLYPNYEIEFVTGFINVFSSQRNQCVGLFANLQNEIMRQILSDMKKSALGSLLDSKLKMLLYLLNSLRHLQDIDRHSNESERTSRSTNTFQTHPMRSDGNYSSSINSSTFLDSYSLSEAYDHLKFMSQILDEIISRGESRVSICDFIQCLFLQLQMIEIMDAASNAEAFMPDLLAPYYSKIIGTLMNLFAYNVDGLPIIVSCLNSILHKYPSFFIAQFRSQPKALECLLHKIYYEKNETAQIFISVANLLRDFATYPHGAALLNEVGIVNSLCNSPLFKSIENEPFYWQNGERNLLHSFWCWTLSLYKEYTLNAPTDLETTFASLQFLQTYFTRIAKILSIPSVLSSTSASAQNRLVVKEQEKLSLAYMEELQEILEVLAVLFCNASIFKRKIPNDFEQILQFLTHCTIHLFKQGLLVQSVFMPVSKMEKKLAAIYDAHSYESSNVMFTSMQTPSQTPHKQSSHEQPSTSSSSILGDNKNKSLNMFLIQIEMHYQRILLSLTSCISDGLSESSLVQLFSYSLHNFSENSLQQESGLIYAVSYWQNFANSLLECLKYAENTLNKWDSRKNKNFNMDEQLQRLNSITNSVEYNLCTYSFSASSFNHSNAKTVLKTTLYSLTQIISATIRHFHLYNSFRQWFGHSIRDSLADVFAKINTKVESFKKIESSDQETMKVIQESIIAFQRLKNIFESQK